jgi:membrane-associated protease RseP (regulator of RpoE activity)
MKRILFALALLLAAALTARADAAPAPTPKPVVVPFDILPSGHITVMAKVNGKGPYKLIFDTGAPMALLNNKIAKEADLLKDVPKPLFSFFGSMGEVKVKELLVGEQAVADLSAMVMDHPTVEAISEAFKDKAGPIDGIVGFPFFARFDMTLDYQAKTMTLKPNGFKPPNVMEGMQKALEQSLSGEPKVLAPAAQWGIVAAKKKGDEEAGVDVTAVREGSPAAAAGVKAGDRLLTLDGRWTDSLVDLYTAAGYVKPGATAAVVVKRDGKEVTLKVKPAAGL